MSNIQDLLNLSATKRLAQMKANLSKNNYIIKDMALAGQLTLFYAMPNTGKTLLFIRFFIDAFAEGRLNAADLFYFNADDNYNGLCEKAQIANQYGFHMISPSEARISSVDILCMLHDLGQNNHLRGKVIVLDTLKKFADMMSKADLKRLFELLRDMGMGGATIIIAGHANKYPDQEGNLVYEGTGDTMNDVDCMYSIYKISPPEDVIQVVEFRNEKDRGTVIPRVSYQYDKVPSCSYMDLINSVTLLSNNQANQVAVTNQNAALIQKYVSEIAFITPLLNQGPKIQSQILAALKASSDPNLSKRKTTSALSDLDGIEWTSTKGSHNSITYALIP